MESLVLIVCDAVELTSTIVDFIGKRSDGSGSSLVIDCRAIQYWVE